MCSQPLCAQPPKSWNLDSSTMSQEGSERALHREERTGAKTGTMTCVPITQQTVGRTGPPLLSALRRGTMKSSLSDFGVRKIREPTSGMSQVVPSLRRGHCDCGMRIERSTVQPGYGTLFTWGPTVSPGPLWSYLHGALSSFRAEQALPCGISFL